jgi:mRNA interferase HigB
LRSFWETPGCADAEGTLRAWHTVVDNKMVRWRAWSDVKATYRNASHVGNCVVFNIGGNKYRLVARILYSSQKVFVLKVMTHAQYDRNAWQGECGCYEQPPSKTGSTARRAKRKRRGA